MNRRVSESPLKISRRLFPRFYFYHLSPPSHALSLFRGGYVRRMQAHRANFLPGRAIRDYNIPVRCRTRKENEGASGIVAWAQEKQKRTVPLSDPKFVLVWRSPRTTGSHLPREPEPREIPSVAIFETRTVNLFAGKAGRVCSPPCSSPSVFPEQFYRRDTPHRQLVLDFCFDFRVLTTSQWKFQIMPPSGCLRRARKAIAATKDASLDSVIVTGAKLASSGVGTSWIHWNDRGCVIYKLDSI